MGDSEPVPIQIEEEPTEREEVTQAEVYGLTIDLRLVLDALFKEASACPELDQRWVGIAKMQMQQGCMALDRAIVKPEGF